jgi:DNA-binding winged helix-turn-helix (wHTH) protein
MNCARPAAAAHADLARQRINLPLTAQRILATLFQRRGEVVSYDECSRS